MEKKPMTAFDTPKLTTYQKLMMEELQKRPDLMQLYKAIFDDYPKVVMSEITHLKGVTKRRQKKGMDIGILRMKLGAYIEERIARLAGIDVDGFAELQKKEDATSTEKMLESVQKVSEAVSKGETATAEKEEKNG